MSPAAGSGSRFFADLLLGLDAMTPARRREIGDYLVAVVCARDFPVHVTNLWNALYFAYDIEEHAYYAQGIEPDALPVRQMHRREGALPVGAFVRVKAAEKELWAEVVYKEGRRSDLQVPGDDLFRQVVPALSGAPASVTTMEEHPVAVLQEALVLDFEAFGSGLNDITPVQFDRLLRKHKWLDEYGHLAYEAVYEPPERADDDDTTAYARYLFETQRAGLLSTFLAVFLDRRATDDEAWNMLLKSFDAVASLAEGREELRSWRGYFFDREAYLARIEDRSADAFLGADDLQHLLDRELRVIPPGSTVGYRALAPELCRFVLPGPQWEARHALFEGPSYVRLVCHANRWIADTLGAERDAPAATPRAADAGPDDGRSLEQVLEDAAVELAALVEDVGDLFRWLRPRLAARITFHAQRRAAAEQPHRSARRGTRSEAATPPVAGAETTSRHLTALAHLAEELPSARLSGREAELDRVADIVVRRLLRSGRDAGQMAPAASELATRTARRFEARRHRQFAHVRLDDAWQSGGIWRVERASMTGSLVGLPPTMALGLGYAGAQVGQDVRLTVQAPEPLPTSDTGWSVMLTVQDISFGELRLIPSAYTRVQGSVHVRVRHGEEPAYSCPATRDASRRVVSGIAWPMSALPGMRVLCNLEGQGRQISVRSTHLVPPKELAGHLVEYEVDEDYYLAAADGHRVDRAVRERATSIRDLIISAFHIHGRSVTGAYELTASEFLAAVLGSDFTPAEARPLLVALQTLEIKHADGAYRWRPRVTRRTGAIDRALLEEFGVARERVRQLVRRVVPMHIRQYVERQPSPGKIRTYAEARLRSGNLMLPRELPPGASWVIEYPVGAREPDYFEEAQQKVFS